MSFTSYILGAVLALSFAAPAVAEIDIHGPYARASSAMAGAAFMVIYNRGAVDDHLLSVTSDVAARTELHTHIEDADGVMRMIHLEAGMVIPAGGHLILKRGGDHVMFMGLVAPFVQDDVLAITLQFEQAGDVVVEVPVDQTRTETDMMDHSDMDHSGMDHGDSADAAHSH